jgi:hypothetical protein
MTRGYQHISWKADQVGKNTAHKRYSGRFGDTIKEVRTTPIKPMGIIDFSPGADPKSAGTPIPNLSPDPPHPHKSRPPFGALPMARNASGSRTSIER